MSDAPAYMIRPGCELAEELCGDPCRCVKYTFCATHQLNGGEWPCEEQKEFEASEEFKLDVLEQEVKGLRDGYRNLKTAHEKLRSDHERVTRLLEQAVFPFMRDVMGEYGSHLSIGLGFGDAPALLGLDKGFERLGRTPGTVYKGADGRTWINGVQEPVKLGERGSMSDMGQNGKGTTLTTEEIAEAFNRPRRIIKRKFDDYGALLRDFERMQETAKASPEMDRINYAAGQEAIYFTDGSSICWKLRKGKK